MKCEIKKCISHFPPFQLSFVLPIEEFELQKKSQLVLVTGINDNNMCPYNEMVTEYDLTRI